MANRLYDKGRQAFLNGGINWLSDDIRVILTDASDYTVDSAEHQYLLDIPVAARVAVSSALTSKSSTNGVADAGDVTFPLVTGDRSEALIIYKHTGTESTSTLIAYIDTATGLPVTPNGGDITVQWDNGANKLFKL